MGMYRKARQAQRITRSANRGNLGEYAALSLAWREMWRALRWWRR